MSLSGDGELIHSKAQTPRVSISRLGRGINKEGKKLDQ
jgi:hypothetical protein